jgi:heat shock protein HslJ
LAIRADVILEPLTPKCDAFSCPACPGGHCSLLREGTAHIPAGSYHLRGVYSRHGARAEFALCPGAVRFAVDPGMRPKLSAALAAATAGGREALITVSAIFQTPHTPGGPIEYGKETITLAALIRTLPGGSCDDALSSEPAPPAPAPHYKPVARDTQADTAAPLVETHWLLTELYGAPVDATAREHPPSLRFFSTSATQGRVNGNGGCNRFSSTYTLAGCTMRFGATTATRMACAPAVMAIESGVFKVLEETRQYELRGTTLELLDTPAHIIARFHASAVPPLTTTPASSR